MLLGTVMGRTDLSVSMFKNLVRSLQLEILVTEQADKLAGAAGIKLFALQHDGADVETTCLLLADDPGKKLRRNFEMSSTIRQLIQFGVS